MPGEIERNELPRGDGGFIEWETLDAHESAPRPTADDIEDLADRLRFMGLADPTILEFERRANDDFERAAGWLETQLRSVAPHARAWSCDCGELLVDDGWRGQATVRCRECGAGWGLDVREDGSGSQRSMRGPTERWLEAQPQVPDDPYGDYQPEAVIEYGLPPMVDGIEPGSAFPLAMWRDGARGGVLYAYRQRPGEYDLPGEEYGHEIEHLRLDPPAGWTNWGSGGGGWVNPFSPPTGLLQKYVVIWTGTSSTSDEEVELCLVGGLTSAVVATIELDEGGVRSRMPVDPIRRVFLVGTRAPEASIRFLDTDGQALTGHRGAALEVVLAGRLDRP